MTAVDFLRLDFGVAPLALPFLALLLVLTAAVLLWTIGRGSAGEATLIGLFALAMGAVLLAQSVAAFFLAWEAMSLVSAFLVVAHHEQRRVRRATLTYLIVAQGGALCILAALSLLAVTAGSASFSAIAQAAPGIAPATRDAVLALALIGFGSKAGLVPLHFWLPRAHPVAPANASAMLSGAMLKIALYGLCLFTLRLAAPAPLAWGVAVMLVGTISALLGVLYALVDHDLKRLLAYHSVENVGIITIGLGIALIGVATHNLPLASLALLAALFHTINHGLFKGLLFLGAGVVSQSEETVDLERLGGLWGHLVWTAPFFLIGCVAIAGLPPFNGFASEWMTFQALIDGLGEAPLPVQFALLAAIAGLALTSGLAVACFVKVFGVAFLGRRRREPATPAIRERFDASTLGQGLLATLCVVLGLVPILVVAPLGGIVAESLRAAPFPLPTLPVLPAMLAAGPFLGALAAIILVASRGLRSAPTWTCGSPVTAAAQYTATAFSKPLRTIFAFMLLPERRRSIEYGVSRWFPTRIRYQTASRYIVDEVARRVAAFTLHWTRRSRLVQSGEMRLYLAYAMAAFILAAVAAR